MSGSESTYQLSLLSVLFMAAVVVITIICVGIYALEVRGQCWGGQRTMLWMSEDNVVEVRGQCCGGGSLHYLYVDLTDESQAARLVKQEDLPNHFACPLFFLISFFSLRHHGYYVSSLSGSERKGLGLGLTNFPESKFGEVILPTGNANS